MARWVTVRLDAFPFDYRVRDKDGKATGGWLHFKRDESDPHDKGERYVPDDQADFIIARGYGVDGKASETSPARSRKGGTPRRKAANRPRNAANAGTVAPVGNTSAVDADRTADRPAMAPDAGE